MFTLKSKANFSKTEGLSESKLRYCLFHSFKSLHCEDAGFLDALTPVLQKATFSLIFNLFLLFIYHFLLRYSFLHNILQYTIIPVR